MVKVVIPTSEGPQNPMTVDDYERVWASLIIIDRNFDFYDHYFDRFIFILMIFFLFYYFRKWSRYGNLEISSLKSDSF